MRAKALWSLFLAALVSAGPVINDCGKRKCYRSENECGMEFGGCWEECANGPTSLQTFVVPRCMEQQLLERQETPESIPTAATVSDIPDPTITPPPFLPPAITDPRNTTNCIKTCVDLITVCDGGATLRWGHCQSECGEPTPGISKSCSHKPRPPLSTTDRLVPAATTSGRKKKVYFTSKTGRLQLESPTGVFMPVLASGSKPCPPGSWNLNWKMCVPLNWGH